MIFLVGMVKDVFSFSTNFLKAGESVVCRGRTLFETSQ